MKKVICRLIVIIICSIFFSCSNNEPKNEQIYNEKANEIIAQTIKKSGCDCILEIPDESMIQISKIERPSYDIRSELIKRLNLKNKSNLDSLVNVSQSFVLDYELIKRNNFKIVSLKDIRDIKMKNDFKMCPKGIICMRKPIFDKDYKKVAVDYGFAFTCIGFSFRILEFKNGEWRDTED